MEDEEKKLGFVEVL
ncbi:Protein of unknown function [Bacillus cytotoxicus]|uniref:Uncharacterized protein n=1 Tax=Bacillus cytotoxicus TaxID=580165 RepID=A0AAX2CLQ6_9BACI|nr:Protein of unknown function [Bacillus cytotoxicus]SCN42350.1 Protein of unknown function [Bacillus cytotoxicus]